MNATRCLALIAFSSAWFARGDDAPPAPRAADCTFNRQHTERAGPELWHRLSQNAELVAPGKRRAVTPPSPRTFVAKSFIDDEVFGKMVKDGVPWTSPSSDAEFLRRVTLDLTGEIPDPEGVKAFLADPGSDKRDRLIAQLLESDAFVDRWTMWLGDLVQNVRFASNNNTPRLARDLYYSYLRSSIASHKPYDQIVRELITATGRQYHDGQVNHWLRELQPLAPDQDTYDNLSATTGSRFLGLQLQCLSCHNGLGHLEQSSTALAKRTRYDFWGNAAFFAQVTVTLDRSTKNLEAIISDNSTGAYRLNTTSGNKTPRQPVNGQDTVEPAFFLTGEGPRPGEGRRAAYARMLTAHPQFARATVNYLWKELFGLGIVEPAGSFDLLRQDQPTHPALLDKLATYFSDSHYDLRALLGLMVRSNAYQLASRFDAGTWNEAWTPYLARHYPRRMMAEALLDSIFKATNQPAILDLDGYPTPMKLMTLPDTYEGGAYAPLLNNFGRGNRDDQPRTSEGSITQTLELMNDPLITARLKATADGSTLKKLLASTKEPGGIADALYLAFLSRYPTEAERAAAVAYLADGDLANNAEDLQFALINRLSFLFN